jgi:hypothetical protein
MENSGSIPLLYFHTMGILFEFAAKLCFYGPTLKPRGFMYINQVGLSIICYPRNLFT